MVPARSALPISSTAGSRPPRLRGWRQPDARTGADHRSAVGERRRDLRGSRTGAAVSVGSFCRLRSMATGRARVRRADKKAPLQFAVRETPPRGRVPCAGRAVHSDAASAPDSDGEIVPDQRAVVGASRYTMPPATATRAHQVPAAKRSGGAYWRSQRRRIAPARSPPASPSIPAGRNADRCTASPVRRRARPMRSRSLQWIGTKSEPGAGRR